MDPWADRVEDISPMDMTDGGDSELEIEEDLIGQKRMGVNNTEGSQAQSTKRFKLNVGFQKHIVSPKLMNCTVEGISEKPQDDK